MSPYGPWACWDCGGIADPVVRLRGQLMRETCDDEGNAILAKLRTRATEAG
ncbi:hypothetical protein [Streptomyces hesseae]|uniref:Uncharacterized protein n=1 Tax=Streptomyces hesseae TaxID=3075519 RepID=A0ABU2SXV3_9ACTN|nr:hypothetical protein [Streptomyces sp. DSM 40473]MDT0453786.1 hypothetical protein [Streptomyces sp. DSM 40473]